MALLVHNTKSSIHEDILLDAIRSNKPTVRFEVLLYAV